MCSVRISVDADAGPASDQLVSVAAVSIAEPLAGTEPICPVWAKIADGSLGRNSCPTNYHNCNRSRHLAVNGDSHPNLNPNLNLTLLSATRSHGDASSVPTRGVSPN